MKEYESFARIGTEPHRSYYIPFAETDTIRTKHGIQDRTSSSRFMSLDGVWQIKQHAHVDDFDIRQEHVYIYILIWFLSDKSTNKKADIQ